MVIASGDGIYKLDYNKVLEYHIAKKQMLPWYVLPSKGSDATRFGVLRMNEDCRIEEFEEKPMVSFLTAFLPVFMYPKKTADRADRAVLPGRPP